MTDAPATPDPASAGPPGLGSFVARVIVVALIACLGLALWKLRDALSVAFGSIILAVGFRGMTNPLKSRFGLPGGVALALVVVACLGAVALAFEVFGATMANQFAELSRRLPESLRVLSDRLNDGPMGRSVLAGARLALGGAVAGAVPNVLARLVADLALGLTYALVMVAGGVFLAIEPARYRTDFLSLVPPARRARFGQVLDALADTLRRWLLARLVVMAAVGVLSSLGLWALGIDAPFALGLTGAILTFIPNVGSVMSALPGMLIAFLQEPVKAIAVAVLFWAVHFVEGTFITPYVQDEAVQVPPVISIFATVAFALLLGPIGVFLAGPFTVVLIVLVNCFYIEDMLGDSAPVHQHEGRRRRWPWRRDGSAEAQP